MPRIPEVTAREQLPAGKEHIWDEITASRGFVRGPFAVLLHSPDFAQRAAHTGTYVRFEGLLPARVRELTVLSTARTLDCGYEFSAHRELASGSGVTPGEVDAIARRDPAGLGEDRWVYDFAVAVVEKHRVPDELFGVAQSRLGLQGVVELAGTIGYYSLLAAALNTFGVEPADPA